MNSRNLKSSSFTSGQYLYTSAGTLSGPVAFAFFSCLTAFSNSDLLRLAPKRLKADRGCHCRTVSLSVAANLLWRNFLHTSAVSSGQLRSLPSVSVVRFTSGGLGLPASLFYHFKDFRGVFGFLGILHLLDTV